MREVLSVETVELPHSLFTDLRRMMSGRVRSRRSMVQRFCDGCRRDKRRLGLVEERRNERSQASQACCNGADIYFESSPDEVAVVIKTIAIFEVSP